MAKHRDNPHMAFWKMLKVGYDHFEVTRQQPKVNVCEKRYVFNAYAPGNASRPLAFQPAGKCPAYEVPLEIVAAVYEKAAQGRDRDRRADPARHAGGADPHQHRRRHASQVFLDALKGPKQDAGRQDPPASRSWQRPAPSRASQSAARPEPRIRCRERQRSRSRALSRARRRSLRASPRPAERARSHRLGHRSEQAAIGRHARPDDVDGASNWFRSARRRRARGGAGAGGPHRHAAPAAVAPARVRRQARTGPRRPPRGPAATPPEASAGEPQVRTAAQAPAPSASLMSGAQAIVPTTSFDSRFGGVPLSLSLSRIVMAGSPQPSTPFVCLRLIADDAQVGLTPGPGVAPVAMLVFLA